jgi:nitrate/nitrite transporter NarK
VWFYLWFRNRPEEKATVNAAELDMIREGRPDREAGHAHVPWMQLFTSRNLWMLCLMYFCAAYGWYFNITYLPRFLEQQHGVAPTSLLGAIYKGGPLWVGAIACLWGGYLSDRYIRRTGNLKWGRRLFGVTGHSLCALCYLACLAAPNAFTFFVAISLAAFFNDLIMGPAWACCQDIGKRYAAIVAGAMNTVGNLGGAVAGWATGTILEQTLASYAASQGASVELLSESQRAAGLFPGYQINFLVFAGVYVLAVIFWFQVDATKPVVAEGSDKQ